MCHILFILFWVSGLSAQSVATHIEPDSGYIGDVFTVTYSLTLPDQARITPPRFEESLEKFKVLSQSSDTRFDADRYTRIFTLKIAAFDTGYQVIPPIHFTIQRTDEIRERESSYKLKSDSLHIVILSALNKAESPPDVYSPLPLSVFTTRQKIILLIVLLLLLLVICNFILRRKKEGLSSQEMISYLSPYEEAKQRLNALDDKSYPGEGSWKRFYLELTAIIKRYIERKFFLHISDLPTNDLIPVLEKEIPEFWTKDMTDLIRYSDLVKFARLETSAEQCKTDLKKIRGWCKKVEINENSSKVSEETEKSS